MGPRVAASPRVLPIKPYAEALLGVGWHRQFGSFGSTDKDFAYELVGGVDHAILPQVDWRVIEFSFGGLGALDSGVHPKTISTGLSLRF